MRLPEPSAPKLLAMLLAATVTVATCDTHEVLHSRTSDSWVPTSVIPQAPFSEHAGALPLQTWAERLRGARQVWVVGREDGPFGMVWDVALDSSAVFVADILMKHVVVVTADGRVRATLAGRGDGPREMRDIVGIARPTDRTLALADYSKIKVLSALTADTIDLVRTIWAGANVMDLCSIQEMLFARIATPRQEGTVLAVPLRDSTRAVYGRSPPSESPDMQYLRNRGRIACTTSPPRVIVAFDHSPDILAYAPDGREVWHATLDGFREPVWKTQLLGKRAGRTRSRQDPYDAVLSIVGLEPGGVLVQVARFAPDETGRPVSPALDSYLLSAEDGTGYLFERSLPLIVAASPHRYVSVRTTSQGYQQVAAFEYVTGRSNAK